MKVFKRVLVAALAAASVLFATGCQPQVAPKVVTPVTFTPASGSVIRPGDYVTLESAKGNEIYYSTVEELNADNYSEGTPGTSVKITADCTVYAIAVDAAGDVSVCNSAEYIAKDIPANVTFTAEGGWKNGTEGLIVKGTNVTLASTSSNVKIYYTLNSDGFTKANFKEEGKSTEYTGPITIDFVSATKDVEKVTVYAIAEYTDAGSNPGEYSEVTQIELNRVYKFGRITTQASFENTGKYLIAGRSAVGSDVYRVMNCTALEKTGYEFVKTTEYTEDEGYIYAPASQLYTAAGDTAAGTTGVTLKESSDKNYYVYITTSTTKINFSASPKTDKSEEIVATVTAAGTWNLTNPLTGKKLYVGTSSNKDYQTVGAYATGGKEYVLPTLYKLDATAEAYPVVSKPATPAFTGVTEGKLKYGNPVTITCETSDVDIYYSTKGEFNPAAEDFNLSDLAYGTSVKTYEDGSVWAVAVMSGVYSDVAKIDYVIEEDSTFMPASFALACSGKSVLMREDMSGITYKTSSSKYVVEEEVLLFVPAYDSETKSYTFKTTVKENGTDKDKYLCEDEAGNVMILVDEVTEKCKWRYSVISGKIVYFINYSTGKYMEFYSGFKTYGYSSSTDSAYRFTVINSTDVTVEKLAANQIKIDLSAQGWANTAELGGVKIDTNGCEVSFANPSNGSSTKYYTSGSAVRFYKCTDTSDTKTYSNIKIAAKTGYKIKSIDFTTQNSGKLSGFTYAGTAEEGTYKATAAAGSFTAVSEAGVDSVTLENRSDNNTSITTIVVTFDKDLTTTN